MPRVRARQFFSSGLGFGLETQKPGLGLETCWTRTRVLRIWTRTRGMRTRTRLGLEETRTRCISVNLNTGDEKTKGILQSSEERHLCTECTTIPHIFQLICLSINEHSLIESTLKQWKLPLKIQY